jgi:hypothetical protein
MTQVRTGSKNDGASPLLGQSSRSSLDRHDPREALCIVESAGGLKHGQTGPVAA